MAISTPVDLGFIASASTPSSLALTTTHAVSSGDCIVVFHYSNGGNSTIVSITDSSSNTYVKLFAQTASAPLAEVWICYSAASMASSSTITLNSFANSALRHGMAAWTITGTANTTPSGSGSPTIPVDLHTVKNNFVQGNTTVSSASIAVQNSYNNNQILIGCLFAGASLSPVTQGGSFTTLGGGTTNAALYPCYQIVANLTGVTYGPSWTSGQSQVAATFSLFGPSTSGGGGIIG